MKRAIITLAVVGALLAVPSLGAQAAVGHNLNIRVNVVSHSFTHHYHHAGGVVAIQNTGVNPKHVTCLVVITWRNNSHQHLRGKTHVSARVPRHSTRRLHFHAKAHDAKKRFNRIPSHAATHCSSHVAH